MSSGLGQHPLARIDQNDGQVGRRSPRNHIAGILLMAWRIRNDEFSLWGREISISHIDGDALFTLGLQSVGKEG
jgi:hypothetical protein